MKLQRAPKQNNFGNCWRRVTAQWSFYGSVRSIDTPRGLDLLLCMISPRSGVPFGMLFLIQKIVGKNSMQGNVHHCPSVRLQPEYKKRNPLWTAGIWRSQFSLSLCPSRDPTDPSITQTLEKINYSGAVTPNSGLLVSGTSAGGILFFPRKG